MAGKEIFMGWQLWQKMTFVLGVAIVLVIAVAYGKLQWVNRKVRKQEVIDEEKRVRINELRETGQLVENTKNDVPFGVRAIQSGIQVDGIWISNHNTPVPSELNLNMGGSVPGSISGGESSKDIDMDRDETTNTTYAGSSVPVQSRDSSPHSERRTSITFTDSAAEAQSLDPRNRKFNQPRRSSGLRYNNNLTYDDAPFGHLGSAQQTYPPRVSSRVVSRASSLADNELNLATSSGSETSYEGKGKGRANDSRTPTQADYIAVPITESDTSMKSTFTAPSQMILHSSARNSDHPTRTSSLDDVSHINSQHPEAEYNVQEIPPPPRVPSSFAPGEVHQNRITRKINPGFELLPAGTFGNPSGSSQKGDDQIMDEQASVTSDEKRKSRLQKRQKEPAASANRVSFQSR